MVVLALPVFLIAGWSIKGWLLAAVLWLVLQALSFLANRTAPKGSSVQALGLVAFLRMFRLLIVLVLLAVLAATRRELVLPVIAVFGLAYTAELGLSLISYFGNEPL